MQEMKRNHLIFCDHPKCKEDGVKLQTLDHFRSHVQSVHGIAPSTKEATVQGKIDARVDITVGFSRAAVRGTWLGVVEARTSAASFFSLHDSPS